MRWVCYRLCVQVATDYALERGFSLPFMRRRATDYALGAMGVADSCEVTLGVLLPIMRWGSVLLVASVYAFHDNS